MGDCHIEQQQFSDINITIKREGEGGQEEDVDLVWHNTAHLSDRRGPQGRAAVWAGFILHRWPHAPSATW